MSQSVSLNKELKKAISRAKQETESQPFPWGFGSGLLTGCAITLIGVAMNLEPMTIMTRAGGGGCVVGVIVALASAGWRLLAPKEEED